MAKYMVIGEEDDGFQFFLTYPSKKDAKKAARRMLRDSEGDMYNLPIVELYVVKRKSMITMKSMMKGLR